MSWLTAKIGLIGGLFMDSKVDVNKVERRLDGLHPRLKEIVLDMIRWLAANHIPFEVFETTRAKERQAYLVKQGYSKTMNSKHIDGRAFDLVRTYYEGRTRRWDWGDSNPDVIIQYKLLAMNLKTLYPELEHGGDWTSTFPPNGDIAHWQLRKEIA